VELLNPKMTAVHIPKCV